MKSKLKAKVIIVGAGSHALVIADIIMDIKGEEIVGFLERDDIVKGSAVRKKKVMKNVSLPIFSDKEIYRRDIKWQNIKLILGLGQDYILLREKLIKKFNDNNFTFYSAVHSRSIVAGSASIGEGTAIMAGAVINPFTRIGDHAVVNTGAVIDHECVIGDNVFIQPGASLAGNVHVGRNSIVGIGASVKEGIRIGSNSIVGGGAFVNKDIPDNVVYAGVPARKLKSNPRRA